MWPLAGFAVGAVVGAAGVILRGAQVAEHLRPAAKAALKAMLVAAHEARIRQVEIVEAAEDLYAEAEAEMKAEKDSETLAKATEQQAAADAARESEIRRAQILEAVQDLYAQAQGEVTSEQLASVIAAAEGRAREATQEAGFGASTQSAAKETSDGSAKRPKAVVFPHG